MSFSSLSLAISTSVLLVHVAAHSWLECADYRGPTAGFQFGDYDVANCMGFPRPLDGGARGVGRQAFGQDIGMDKQAQRTDASPQCHTGRVANSAYGQYPRAQYNQGGTYTLAWPAKNHAAAECTNANIPDGGLKIFASGLNPTEDPNFSTFQATEMPTSFSATTGVPHQNGAIDFEGFQKCEDFCANTDKAFCHGTMTIPADMAIGDYTFQWYWEFNTGQIYVTCFEVSIAAAEEGENPTTPTGAQPTSAPTVVGQPVVPTPRPTRSLDDLPAPVSDGEDCDLPPATNTVAVYLAPSAIHANIRSFIVRLCYTATVQLVLVAELIDAQTGQSYGFGAQEVTPSSSADTAIVLLTMLEQPPVGAATILRAWNVQTQYYRDWVETPTLTNPYELNRREYGMTVTSERTSSAMAPRMFAGVFVAVLTVLIMY